MSVEFAQAETGWFDGALRVTAVTAAWAVAVLVTAAMSRPAPGTELVVPVVVAVALAVVMLFGRVIGSALVVLHAGLLAMLTWGEVGGLVLLSSTFAALVLLPLPFIPTNPTHGEDY